MGGQEELSPDEMLLSLRDAPGKTPAREQARDERSDLSLRPPPDLLPTSSRPPSDLLPTSFCSLFDLRLLSLTSFCSH